ncbi:MAG: hypothetical protein N3J91_09995 [Verrucomicrobiae bacterium]|nr:hypothetical protein [Verrucomicrobiae bacterium]
MKEWQKAGAMILTKMFARWKRVASVVAMLAAGLGDVLGAASELDWQTHFSVTWQMTASLVISNRMTNFSYCHPFTLQRRGSQWRMKVAWEAISGPLIMILVVMEQIFMRCTMIPFRRTLPKIVTQRRCIQG